MPQTPSISGGFAKSFRKELHSDVWMMPPIYHRVWYWLRLNVQHEVYLFPTRERFGIWVLPGQRMTSLLQIAEGVAWREWGKEKVPNKRTIKAVLDWLEVQKMVTAVSNAKGTLISIVNWHSYNDVPAEKVTANSNAQYTRSAHKEEGIEGKEIKSSSVATESSSTVAFNRSSEKFEGITDAMLTKWQTTFHGVDVHSEIAKAEAWVIANPSRAKKNWHRFIVGWLGRAKPATATVTLDNSYLNDPAFAVQDSCYE